LLANVIHTDIKKELDYCSFDFNYRIKYALDNAVKEGYKPISFEKLKKYNVQLYDKLEQQ
jgi:hypothetical protein